MTKRAFTRNELFTFECTVGILEYVHCKRCVELPLSTWPLLADLMLLFSAHTHARTHTHTHIHSAPVHVSAGTLTHVCAGTAQVEGLRVAGRIVEMAKRAEDGPLVQRLLANAKAAPHARA